MNKKLMVTLIVLSFPLSVLAGQSQQGNSSPAHRVERMTQELGLSEDQQSKVEAIFNAQKEKMKAIHAETRTSLQSVLTQEQMAKFDEMHQQARQR